MDTMALGENVRRLRKKHKFTLLELAGRAEMDAGNLSKLERELMPFIPESLVRLSDVLGVTLADLVSDDSNVEPTLIGTRRALPPALPMIPAAAEIFIAAFYSLLALLRWANMTLRAMPMTAVPLGGP